MSIKKIQFSPIKERVRVTNQTDNVDGDDEEEQQENLSSTNNLITVKFQITETQIIAQSFRASLSVKQIKRDIAGKFKVPDNVLRVYDDQQQWIKDEEVLLNDLSRNQFGIVELRLELAEHNGDENKTKLDLSVYYSNFTLTEIITVNVDNGDDVTGEEQPPGGRKIIVEIDNRQILKPFLGGFRDPTTKIEYHNASTQTGPMKVFRHPILTRDTQTEAHLVRSLRTTRTPRNEIREFVSSDEMLVRLERVKAVRVIQRNFRSYRWRKLIRESAEQWRIIQQKARERLNCETSNENYNRVLRLLFMQPTEKEDFDRIHAAIEHWKREEKARLQILHGDSATAAAYISELSVVVEKEIFLLNEVSQRKKAVRLAFQEKSSQRLLNKLGKPKRFISKINSE